MNDNLIILSHYIERFLFTFPELRDTPPWSISTVIEQTLQSKIKGLGSEYTINGSTAIHRSAKVEDNVTLKGPVIISAGCFVGSHAYLRGGVFLGEKSVIGPGCEVKSSVIMEGTALAHFNFVGDSWLGSAVNMEAGSVIANHFNERQEKMIYALINGNKKALGVTKFGAVVGDRSKIGANAVLSPGTVLAPSSVVKRLELVEQC